jgi:hypothetical protein
LGSLIELRDGKVPGICFRVSDRFDHIQHKFCDRVRVGEGRLQETSPGSELLRRKSLPETIRISKRWNAAIRRHACAGEDHNPFRLAERQDGCDPIIGVHVGNRKPLFLHRQSISAGHPLAR